MDTVSTQLTLYMKKRKTERPLESRQHSFILPSQGWQQHGYTDKLFIIYRGLKILTALRKLRTRCLALEACNRKK